MPFVKTIRGVYGPTGRTRSIPKTVITGGDSIQVSGGYRIHYYTNTGSSTFNTSTYGVPLTVEYLVVGGGGAGGRYVGGGGGAGGYLSGSLTIPASSHTVTVGTGAAAAAPSPAAAPVGTNSVFSSITATRGGPGGIYPNGAGSPGGSGGGAGGYEAGGPGGAGTPGQGNNGGPSYGPRTTNITFGAGGGGAGAVGGYADNYGMQPAPGNSVQNYGGNGITSPITGFIYGGGGGGGLYNPYGASTPPGYDFLYYNEMDGGAGGGGGGTINVSITTSPGYNNGAGYGGVTYNPVQYQGGNGTVGDPAAGGAGATNSGGGGGGAGHNGPWSAGGPGVVIVRYLF